MDGVPEARSHTLGHGDVGVRTNNTSHNGCLQVKLCGQKGVLTAWYPAAATATEVSEMMERQEDEEAKGVLCGLLVL